MSTVNIKIRNMNGIFATDGIFLEDGNYLDTPKLGRGEVVTVPQDHPIFESSSMGLIEITQEPATRPYKFDSPVEAFAHMTGDQIVAANMAMRIKESQDITVSAREANKAQLLDIKRRELEELEGGEAFTEGRANNSSTRNKKRV